MTCCEKPSTVSHDYEAHGESITNRMCLNCGHHWHGPQNDIKEYTRREWDAYVEVLR